MAASGPPSPSGPDAFFPRLESRCALGCTWTRPRSQNIHVPATVPCIREKRAICSQARSVGRWQSKWTTLARRLYLGGKSQFGGPDRARTTCATTGVSPMRSGGGPSQAFSRAFGRFLALHISFSDNQRQRARQRCSVSTLLRPGNVSPDALSDRLQAGGRKAVSMLTNTSSGDSVCFRGLARWF